jgi:hypothetical protein
MHDYTPCNMLVCIVYTAVVGPGRSRAAPCRLFECRGSALTLLLKTMMSNIGGVAKG